MKTKILIGATTLTLFFSGCAGLMVAPIPNDTLLTATASKIGVPEKDLTLSEQKISGMQIFYTAKTKKSGSFMCIAQGGGAATFGMLTGVECTKAH